MKKQENHLSKKETFRRNISLFGNLRVMVCAGLFVNAQKLLCYAVSGSDCQLIEVYPIDCNQQVKVISCIIY